MKELTINEKLEENLIYLEKTLGKSADIIYRHFMMPRLQYRKAFLVYVDGLVNVRMIDDTILRPLVEDFRFPEEKWIKIKGEPMEIIMKSGVLTSGVVLERSWKNILDRLLSGETILFLEGAEEAMIHSTRGWESRAVTEPTTEGEIRAPRDGFIESIRANTALLRRRIRDYDFRLETMQIGTRTKTDVVLAYIDSLIDPKILKELKNRLDRIKVDSILESGYLEEYIEDNPYSPFPQIEHTERPDKAAAAILEGRIVVLVDNTPFVLIVPAIIWQFIQATGDYMERYFIGTFLRWLRMIAFIVSFTLTALDVALVSFHQEMLPTPLALAMAAGREGVPFPVMVEALLMEFMFEILREAGLRMPKPVGQAVSIVGALVIGEAAVSAGIVSPIMVVVVASAGICSFAIPSYNLAITLRLLRFPIIILSGILGVFGFLFGTILVAFHLLSLRSFGAPYLAPVAPLRPAYLKDVLVRAPWWSMLKRPRITKSPNAYRQIEEKDLKPKPPSKE